MLARPFLVMMATCMVPGAATEVMVEPRVAPMMHLKPMDPLWRRQILVALAVMWIHHTQVRCYCNVM